MFVGVVLVNPHKTITRLLRSLRGLKQGYRYRIGTGRTGLYVPFRPLNGVKPQMFRFRIYFARHRCDSPISVWFACTARNITFRSVPFTSAFCFFQFLILITDFVLFDHYRFLLCSARSSSFSDLLCSFLFFPWLFEASIQGIILFFLKKVWFKMLLWSMVLLQLVVFLFEGFFCHVVTCYCWKIMLILMKSAVAIILWFLDSWYVFVFVLRLLV